MFYGLQQIIIIMSLYGIAIQGVTFKEFGIVKAMHRYPRNREPNFYIPTMCVYIYIYIVKTQKKSNYILIGFSILCHMSHLIFNFVLSELLSVKIE